MLRGATSTTAPTPAPTGTGICRRASGRWSARLALCARPAALPRLPRLHEGESALLRAAKREGLESLRNRAALPAASRDRNCRGRALQENPTLRGRRPEALIEGVWWHGGHDRHRSRAHAAAEKAKGSPAAPSASWAGDGLPHALTGLGAHRRAAARTLIELGRCSPQTLPHPARGRLSVWDLNKHIPIDRARLRSQGGATPSRRHVFGACL
jgi:hypothetical protein